MSESTGKSGASEELVEVARLKQPRLFIHAKASGKEVAASGPAHRRLRPHSCHIQSAKLRLITLELGLASFGPAKSSAGLERRQSRNRQPERATPFVHMGAARALASLAAKFALLRHRERRVPVAVYLAAWAPVAMGASQWPLAELAAAWPISSLSRRPRQIGAKGADHARPVNISQTNTIALNHRQPAMGAAQRRQSACLARRRSRIKPSG